MSAGKFKPAAMYGITRVEAHGVAGWKVDLTRNGFHFSKMFHFAIWGGEVAALAQARAWRDEIVKKHPPRSRQQNATQLRQNNKTGIAGVTCQFGPDGTPRAWVAKTHLSPTEILSKYFSVGRYGAEAKQLAIAERQKQLENLTGRMVVHPAEEMVREAPSALIPPEAPARVTRAEIVLRSNRSGVPGVYRTKGKGQHPGFWSASTQVDGKKLTKFFSVETYGETKAKELAIAERKRQLDAMLRPASSATRRSRTKVQELQHDQGEQHAGPPDPVPPNRRKRQNQRPRTAQRVEEPHTRMPGGTYGLMANAQPASPDD